ncbi:uncharacterized protein PG986_015032 [Apiospora aurea]|uniref:Cytochrome P450 n=1 Tax=Apiospora aurea TaxID=335848 RepID=A0ABR1PRW4_9PEZI
MFGGHDPREPPLAPSSLPIVGHLLGMMKSKFNYYVELSTQTDAPIFTLTLPGRKLYVVTKPEIIQKVQKIPRVLAFLPVEAKFASTVCGASQAAQAILARNVNGDEGGHGLMMESYAAMHEALKPGPLLDDMNRSMIHEIAMSLDELQPASGESRKLGLYAWLRESITAATTRSVYGPLSPYEDKSIADAFWEFESGIMSILVGVLPWLTARKPIAARDRVAEAFEAYYRAGGVQKGSALAQMRYQAEVDNHVPLEDMARWEVGGSIAILVNTAPSAFWTLLLLHSSPGLVEEIRKEIDACTETTSIASASVEGAAAVPTLDITTLKERCPLLLSSYQEGLRYTSIGTSVREVMEDTYLEGYLLTKGAMLQMPSRVIHQDTGLWGPGAAEFDPRRFLAENKQNRPGGDACFRAFGGGKTLCPGRHLATNEILTVVALFVARFDMRPAGGGGSGSGSSVWTHPSTLKSNAAAVVMQPDHDVEVEITNREGFDGDVKWTVNLHPSEKTFALVTEDNEERGQRDSRGRPEVEIQTPEGPMTGRNSTYR